MAGEAVSISGIWTLVLTSAALMGSPGPSTMSVTAVGAALGLRRSLGFVAGLIVGTSAVLLAVASGIVATLWSVPRLAPVLAVASTAYIVVLAVRIARAPPPRPLGPAGTAPSFAGGLLLAIANPKAYVAIAAVFAGATLGGSSPATEALLKIAILGPMIVVIHFGWLLTGASLARVLRDPVASRAANLAFAAALLATSLLPLLR
jgi:threonine/homoserine/homoserine lactone efflux protein